MPESKPFVKPITQKRLMNIALYYLERYESSSENLRQVLRRRILRAEKKGVVMPVKAQEWIDSVIAEMQRLGYVDDKRFAFSITEKYRKAGKSQRYICQKLTQSGVSPEIQKEALGEKDGFSADAELEAALLLVKKKKLGFLRSEEDRSLFRKKDLAVLARAGFSYQTAVKALGEASPEEDENVWD
ncbi:MAG: regulatory protein RecX [Alphaproteobacteria bacterium]|nr:regulatory protein RecX [Alphaproteobacteria bacterium]